MSGLPYRRREKLGDSVTLYLGDCLEIMPTLRGVEAIICDPPYGNNNHDGDLNDRFNEHRGIQSKPIANDGAETMRAVVDGMLRHAVAILPKDRSVCACFCGGGGGPSPIFAWLAERMDRLGLEFFHSCIWDKRNPGLGLRYRRQHEMLMVAHRRGGRIRWNPKCGAVPNIFSQMPDRVRVHPNEKPLQLMERIVNIHTAQGETVLDPFMGSGTTGVACVRLDRKFVGIELDPAHFETACSRISAELARPRLPFCDDPVAEKQEPLL